MRITWILICCMVLIGCYPPHKVSAPIGLTREELKVGLDVLKKAPSVAGYEYRCKEMVHVVNYLRACGKDKALALLRKYLKYSQEDDKVLIICRLLFLNPEGWTLPGLGQPTPQVHENVAQRFPLFPIGLSHRVPFFLITGYLLKGKGESAVGCLKLCERLALVNEDYPLDGYGHAARALIQSDSFRHVYKSGDKNRIAEMILRQAGTAESR